MYSISQSFSVPYHYQVYFTSGLFTFGNHLFKEALGKADGKKLYFVVDEGVMQHHPQLLNQIRDYFNQLDGYRLCEEILIVPGGEQAKNGQDWPKKILEATHTFGIDRHSYIVGIGGGAVLDMVGFAAAIAHRGIRHIRVPTTVLAQNDSGIGVKNSINYFNKKNYLGTFAPPFAVFNDSDFLTTLNERDWRAGISEAIKVALIKDESFFRYLEENAEKLVERDGPVMQKLIYDCAKMHLDHIAKGDPFEMGSSRPLDFGHWAAHKLEQLSRYEIRHGEAVAIGIALDSTYAHLSGMITEREWHAIVHLIKKLGFDLFKDELLLKEKDGATLSVLQGLKEFQEHLGGILTITLLEGIGKGMEVHEMDADKIVKSIHILKNL